MCHLFVFHETTNGALQSEGLRNHVSSFYSWTLCFFLRCCITARGSEKALRNCTSSLKEKTRQKKKQIKAKRSVCYKYIYIFYCIKSCHQFSCHSAQIFWGQFDVSERFLTFISASTFSADGGCCWHFTGSNRTPWQLQQSDHINGAAAV